MKTLTINTIRMKNIENKKIAIVGGGPGGLTLARLLQIKGANVKVYERDVNKDVRVQGATLDLHHGCARSLACDNRLDIATGLLAGKTR